MRSFRSLSTVVLTAYTLAVVAPVLAFLLSALWTGVGPESWSELWRQTTRSDLLLSSLTLSAGTATGATLIGVPIGFLLSRTDLPYRRPLSVLCALPLFLPPFIWAIAWQAGLQERGLQGMGGAIFVMTLSLYPVVAGLAAVGFSHVAPALEEDVRTLGGEAQVFRHVTLPLARPLITTGFLLVFLLTLSEFGVPALMQVHVYPVAIYTAFSAFYDFGRAAILCLPLLAVATASTFALHRITRNLDVTSLAEEWEPRRIPMGRARGVSAVMAFVLLLALVTVPMGALVAKAGKSFAFNDAWESLLWSVPLAATAATILTALALPMAWLCRRGYAGGSRAWLQLQPLLFVLPSTVVGLGLVNLWNRPFLPGVYGTVAMVVLGYVARFAPLMVQTFAAFLAQVPRDTEEAVWMDGGGAGVTFLCLILPVAARAAALLWALCFVLCMGELAVTILVAPPGIQTLAVRLFTIEANAPEARTASLTLILVASCLIPLVVCGIALKGWQEGNRRIG